MMRPSLFHRSGARRGLLAPGERARLRARRTRRAARPAARVTAVEVVQADTEESRVRAAGGPEDLATYTCSCGLMFSAPVSTTVACPHCGAGQAW